MVCAANKLYVMGKLKWFQRAMNQATQLLVAITQIETTTYKCLVTEVAVACVARLTNEEVLGVPFCLAVPPCNGLLLGLICACGKDAFTGTAWV